MLCVPSCIEGSDVQFPMWSATIWSTDELGICCCRVGNRAVKSDQEPIEWSPSVRRLCWFSRPLTNSRSGLLACIGTSMVGRVQAVPLPTVVGTCSTRWWPFGNMYVINLCTGEQDCAPALFDHTSDGRSGSVTDTPAVLMNRLLDQSELAIGSSEESHVVLGR